MTNVYSAVRNEREVAEVSSAVEASSISTHLYSSYERRKNIPMVSLRT